MTPRRRRRELSMGDYRHINSSASWEESYLNDLTIEGSFDPNEALQGKKILVMTDLFPPHFAPRIASIIRFFVSWGADCEVFTEEIQQERSKAHGRIFDTWEDPCPVHRLPLRKTHSKMESLKQALWQTKDRLFAKEIARLTNVAKYDIILAFSFSLFPLKAAQSIAKKYQKPLIIDCRDIYEQYSGYSFLPGLPEHVSPWLRFPLTLLRKYLIRSRNQAINQAQAVTTVSPWHKRCLTWQIASSTPEVLCLFNGYEEQLFKPSHKKTERFRIVFTGRILTLGMRNPSLLFDALATTELQEWISEEKVEVNWYVDEYSRQLLLQLLEAYPPSVQAVQHFFPMVPFEEVSNLLAQASVILLLNNREEPSGPHGIVSTKIFEAMAMQKPILSIPGDSAISDAILKRGNAGCCASSTDGVKQFLKACYRSWQKNGYTCTADADRDFIQCFTRENIARAFARLTDTVWRASLYSSLRL